MILEREDDREQNSFILFFKELYITTKAILQIKIFQALIICAFGGNIYYTYFSSNGSVNNSFELNSEGSKGIIENGKWKVELPLTVTNGLAEPIYEVSMDETIYACQSLEDPISECKRITSFQQTYYGEIDSGGTQSYEYVREGSAGSDYERDGYTEVKVISKMAELVDQAYIENAKTEEYLDSYDARNDHRKLPRRHY